MTFKEFCNEVRDSILDYMPSEYAGADVEIREVAKNGGTLTGLSIRKSSDKSAVPTLYLDDYYAAYEKDGMALSEVVDMLAEIYERADNNKSEVLGNDAQDIVNNLTDYNAVKDLIIPRVVAVEGNEEYLNTYPSSKHGDLTTTYRIVLTDQASIPVPHELLERWGISLEELDKKAMENFKENPKTKVTSMLEILSSSGAFPEELLEDMRGTDADQIIVTNESKTLGATNLLDTDTLDAIEAMNGKFYILPSSIHECIIMPKSFGVELSALEDMVREVNRTQVAPNERLSDNVFEYDSLTKQVVRAVDEEMKTLEMPKSESRKEKGEVKD